MNYNECIENNIVLGDFDGKIVAIFFTDERNLVYQIKNSIIGDAVLDVAKRHINQFVEEDNITDFDDGVETGKKSKDLLEFCRKHSKELKSKPSE